MRNQDWYPGDPRASAAGEKGGAIRGTQLQQQRESGWRQLYPDVPVEVARRIRLEGYNSGFATGFRKGRQVGRQERVNR